MRNFWFQFKSRCFNPLWNIITILLNKFIKRDKKIALFGGRNRDSFSGNARFVFQYLAEHKKEYGFTHVVWVTENPKLIIDLRKMGYDCYDMHSKESIYYHIKAGYHVISGAFSPALTTLNKGKKAPADIIVGLSHGAECIFMDHVVFLPKDWEHVENTVYNSPFEHAMVGLMRFMNKSNFINNNILYAGGWGSPTILCYDKRDKGDNVILALYPALCPCVRFTPEENRLFKKLKKKRIILYSPTFRITEKIKYRSPLEYKKFCLFLRDNNLFWIEKLHANASPNMRASKYYSNISMLIDKEMDINVLCQKAAVMVTDYSSTYQKAIYHKIPFSFWAEDLEYYNNYDYGLNKEFMEFAGDMLCKDIDSLISDLSQKLKPGYVEEHNDIFEKGRKLYFDMPDDTLGSICDKLFKRVG